MRMRRRLYLTRRVIRHWWQRRTRGWDDTDLWSLDFALFAWLLPRLRVHRDTFHGTPGKYWDHEQGTAVAYTEDEWRDILSEVIWALEWIVENEDWPWKSHSDYRRVMRGYGLLVKWLPAMWD